MAISDKFIVTGITGGEGGLVNVGTGRNVTWPTTGNPSFANAGLYFTTAEGASAVNITTAADRGVLKPWGVGFADAKPWWATGPGYLECPAAATGRRFSMISDTEANALNSELTDGAGQAEIDFEGGLLFTVGFQIYTDPTLIQHTAEPTITPANAPGMQSMHEVVNGSGSALGQLRINPQNAGGFRPGCLIANGAYGPPHREDWLATNIIGGYGHIPFNRWYPLQVWIRRATTNGGNNGEIRWYLGGTLVSRVTDVNVWVATNNWRLQHWASLLSGWTTARTGVQFRICAPLKIQAVPEADLPDALITNWKENQDLGIDLARHWPALAPVYPLTRTVVSGSPTAPVFGRELNIGGVRPGIAELPLAGPADAEQMIEFPPVWKGTALDNSSPFGRGGWTHISLNCFNPNGTRVAYRVRNAADDGNITEVVFDDSGTGTFTVNGVTVLSGRTALPARSNWQIVLHIKPGDARVTLVRLTDPALSTGLGRTFSTTCTYVEGTAIGKPQVAARNIGALTARVSGVTVNRENRIVIGNSFTGAMSAGNTYAVSGVNQGTKTVTVATMEASAAVRSRKPEAGEVVEWTGNSGGNNGWYTVASSTNTTITFVESIPAATANGSIDLASPSIGCLANRLGQYIPNRYDSDAVAPPYQFMHPLHNSPLGKVHCLIALARSGERLSDFVANVLPQIANMPVPQIVGFCLDVNDTFNSTSVEAMVADTAGIVADMKTVRNWAIDRGGTVTFGAGINGQNTGVVMNGWAARFRRKAVQYGWMAFVADCLGDSRSEGNVQLLNPPALMDGGAITLAGDGLHPDSATATGYMEGAYIDSEAQRFESWISDDGTVIEIGGSGGGGVFAGTIGGTIG
jgi:hypothetical protein